MSATDDDLPPLEDDDDLPPLEEDDDVPRSGPIVRKTDGMPFSPPGSENGIGVDEPARAFEKQWWEVMFDVPGIHHIIPAVSGGFAAQQQEEAASDEEMADEWISDEETLSLLAASLGAPVTFDKESLQLQKRLRMRAIAEEAPAPATM